MNKPDVKRLALSHLASAAKALQNLHPAQAVEHARKAYVYAVAWQTKVEKGNE